MTGTVTLCHINKQDSRQHVSINVTGPGYGFVLKFPVHSLCKLCTVGVCQQLNLLLSSNSVTQQLSKPADAFWVELKTQCEASAGAWKGRSAFHLSQATFPRLTLFLMTNNLHFHIRVHA